MKSILWLSVLFLLATAGFVSAQQAPASYNEIVVEIKHYNSEKMLTGISSQLYMVSPSSKVDIVCEEQGWLLFVLDKNEINDREHLAAILKQSQLDFIIKDGASRKEMIAACTGQVKKF